TDPNLRRARAAACPHRSRSLGTFRWRQRPYAGSSASVPVPGLCSSVLCPFCAYVVVRLLQLPLGTWAANLSSATAHAAAHICRICDLVRKIASQVVLERSAVARLYRLLIAQRLRGLARELGEPLLVRRVQVEKVG